MPNLTIQAGLRWEAQIEPDPITPRLAGLLRAVHREDGQGADVPLRRDDPLGQERCGSRASGSPGILEATARRSSARNVGLFYARIPGLALASTRSTNGSLGQTLYRDSTFRELRRPASAGLSQPAPGRPRPSGTPDHPGVFVIDEDFQNPRTTAASRRRSRGSRCRVWPCSVKYNYAKSDAPDALRGPQRPAELGSPWSTRPRPGSDQRRQRSDDRRVHGAQEPVLGVTVGVQQALHRPRSASRSYYTYSKDKSDDDNERDPFTFRYAKIHEDPATRRPSSRRSGATPTATSATA